MSGPAIQLGWRAQREGDQVAMLPAERVALTCSAPLGSGGLGRHAQEIAQALERRGAHVSCICGPEALARSDRPGLDLRWRATAAGVGPLARRSPAWRAWKASTGFDSAAAARLPEGDHLLAFNGQALAQLRAARRAGYRSVSLVSANSHLRKVLRQHALAHRLYPIEGSWAPRLLRRNLREYATVDRIFVASHYTRESFLAEGVSEERLSLFPLIPAPRFTPSVRTERSSTFDILYVGGLTVAKGVPLLIDAFTRLNQADMRLRLVGGPASRGMRRFLDKARARDQRIAFGPGDPLPHLRASDLHVHPAYEDGFGYAPAEALACGVPLIVSEDTGMKDMIGSERQGIVLPTGDLDALTEAIASAYRGEILVG